MSMLGDSIFISNNFVAYTQNLAYFLRLFALELSKLPNSNYIKRTNNFCKVLWSPLYYVTQNIIKIHFYQTLNLFTF